jgi:hypothetical protein
MPSEERAGVALLPLQNRCDPAVPMVECRS